MKKVHSLLISILLCATLFFQTGICPTLAAVETNSQSGTKNVSLVDLVRLKKHLAGVRSYIGDADYNMDGKIDAMDIVALRRLLLGLPIDTDKVESTPDLDKDGYYNQVIKP